MQTPLQSVPPGQDASHEPSAAEPRSGAVTALPLPVRELPMGGSDLELATVVRQLDVMSTAFIPTGVSIREGLDTSGKAAVVIFGHVSGPIEAGDKPVYVMPGGSATGPIHSSTEVLVAGDVGTDASAPAVLTEGRFVLAGSGRVQGDVQYRSLRVHEGGTIAGRLLPAPLASA